MPKETRSEDYYRELAIKVIDLLRPERLRIREVKQVLHCALEALDWVPLREKPVNKINRT